MKPTFVALFSVCLFLPVTAADKITVPLWEFKTGGPVTSSPSIGSDGTVYVGSDDKKLYAINGKSGVKLWEFETGGIVSSSPAIGSDGTLYVGSHDKKLYAINGKSGVKLWEFETGGIVSSSPAIGSDGTVYVGSNDNKVYALGRKVHAVSNGTFWQFEMEGVVEDPAIGSDGTVYVGSHDKKLSALNGKTGVKQWEFETGDRVVSSPAIGPDGTVYIGSGDKKIYALDGKSGAKKWEFETGDRVVSSPAIGPDGTVYVGSNDNKLYALNLKHGAEMAAKEVKAHMALLEKLKKLPDGKKTFTTVKGIYLGMNIYRAADVLNKKDPKLKLKVGAPAAKSPGLADLNPLMFLTGPKKETPMKDRRIIVEENGVYLEAGLDAQITIIRFSRTACDRLFDAAGLSNEKFYEEFSKAYRVGTSRFFSESNRVGITDLNLSESGRIYENSKEGYRVRFVFNRSYRDTTGNSQSITRGMNRDAKDKDWLNIEKTRKSKFGD